MWASGFKGGGIKIAILDTGVDSSHPMLLGRIAKQLAFTGEDHLSDVQGHGTHVVGIAAGKKFGAQGYDGVAPDASIYNAKVLDDGGFGQASAVIAGINFPIHLNARYSPIPGLDYSFLYSKTLVFYTLKA